MLKKRKKYTVSGSVTVQVKKGAFVLAYDEDSAITLFKQMLFEEFYDVLDYKTVDIDDVEFEGE